MKTTFLALVLILSLPTLAFALPDSAVPDPAVQVETARASILGNIDKHQLLAPKTRDFVKTVLVECSFNEVFAAAVSARNAKKVPLDEIRRIDEEWKAAEDELPIQKELLGNDCAREIRRVAGLHGTIVEAFVMDDQGANVGQNALTSDYWQGDEDKWKNSFNSGSGGVDVGKVTFDKSANAQLQQISLPIFDSSGKVIGAVTWGLNVDSL